MASHVHELAPSTKKLNQQNVNPNQPKLSKNKTNQTCINNKYNILHIGQKRRYPVPSLPNITECTHYK